MRNPVSYFCAVPTRSSWDNVTILRGDGFVRKRMIFCEKSKHEGHPLTRPLNLTFSEIEIVQIHTPKCKVVTNCHESVLAVLTLSFFPAVSCLLCFVAVLSPPYLWYVLWISVHDKGHLVCNWAMLTMSCTEYRSTPLLLSAVVHMSPCAGSLSAQMEKH